MWRTWISSSLNQLRCIKHIEISEREKMWSGIVEIGEEDTALCVEQSGQDKRVWRERQRETESKREREGGGLEEL